MAYEIKYQISFRNVNEVLFELYILQDAPVTEVTQLKGTGETITYKIIDNNENAYSPIQASELTINFVDEGNFNLREFIEAAVTETFYKVELWCDTSIIWTGFLDTEGCSESIIDPPRIVQLRAQDGIGFLKLEAFTDHDDEFQYGKHTLLQVLEWCIAKTSLQLNLYSAVNVFEDAMDDKDDNPVAIPFDQCKIHTRSIKEQNCYDIIQSICNTFSASFFQYNGAWWIYRKHDAWNDRYHWVTIIEYPYITGDRFTLNLVHRPDAFTPINTDHIRTLISPLKKSQTTYLFKVPEDIPRNKNFEGDFYAPVSGPSNRANTFDGWAYEMGLILSPTPVATTPYRNQVYDALGNISETYIVLPRDTPTGTDTERLISEGIEVSEFDKATISFSHRLKFNVSGSGSMIVGQIILYGNSGQKYTLDDSDIDGVDQLGWFPTIASATGQSFTRAYSGGSETTWKDYSFKTQAFPEDGVLALWLYESSPSVTANESWFKGVKLGFELFINDSLNITGERASNSQDGIFRGENINEIFIGDSPKKIISGALFLTSDDTVLTRNWQQFGYPETSKKLLQLSSLAYFQLGYRYKTKVDGSLLGLLYPLAQTPYLNALMGPLVELVFAPTLMAGIKYLPTNLTLNIQSDTGSVYLTEFYNADEEENPVGDTETLTYLYG